MNIFLCKYENKISRQSNEGTVHKTMLLNVL